MSTERSSAVSAYLGLPGVLFVVFLVLKLCKVILWSWWWVTAPLWVPVGLGLVGLLVVAAVCWLGTCRSRRRRRKYGRTF